MCSCVDIAPGTWANSVLIPCPHHMAQYRRNRNVAGLNGDWIQIDRCILDEIIELWLKGIHTRGCCCGHNKYESFVNVIPEQSSLMLRFGYIMNHPDKSRIDTFKLKTA